MFLKKRVKIPTGDLYSRYVVLPGIGSLPCKYYIYVYTIYIYIRYSFWGVATLDVWSSWTGTLKKSPPKWSMSFCVAFKEWVFQAHRRVPPKTGVVELWWNSGERTTVGGGVVKVLILQFFWDMEMVCTWSHKSRLSRILRFLQRCCLFPRMLYFLLSILEKKKCLYTMVLMPAMNSAFYCCTYYHMYTYIYIYIHTHTIWQFL